LQECLYFAGPIIFDCDQRLRKELIAASTTWQP
jgi:hypothetical protein